MNGHTPAARTNEEWLMALSAQDGRQEEALMDLRNLLLRAALFTLASHLEDLSEMDERDRLAMAEDCAQDAVQAVLARLSDFRGESKFTTWAYKFGINIALTRARREGWKHISLEAMSEENDDALDWMQWKDGAKHVISDTLTLQDEVRAAILEAMQTELTSRQRLVLKLVAFDDVPMDVVVERLGSNRNAVYKLLHDARLKIKRKLAARGYEVEEVYSLFGAVS